MPISVVDLYQKVLPKTNCKECGFPSCLAFASMVVSEKFPLEKCPHISEEQRVACMEELDKQYAEGKWLRKDPAQEALKWAKERSASVELDTLPDRIGGKLGTDANGPHLELPYFDHLLLVRKNEIRLQDGKELNFWEQVFIYNHLAQGGSVLPGDNWKALEEFPNTVSKIISMREHVEKPILEKFSGRSSDLAAAGEDIGGVNISSQFPSVDVALRFTPLPRVPVQVLFWERAPEDGLDAKVKFLFDATVTEHLDIESILFMSERIRQMLCGEDE